MCEDACKTTCFSHSVFASIKLCVVTQQVNKVKIFGGTFPRLVLLLQNKRKNYGKELLKTSLSMIKGIAVQAAQLKGNQNTSLSFDDVCGMVNFSLALGCQISEAEKTNRGKVIAEGVIGGT